MKLVSIRARMCCSRLPLCLIRSRRRWERTPPFLTVCMATLPGREIPKFRPEHFTNDYGFITDYPAEFTRELRKEQYGDALDKYFRLGKNLNRHDTIAARKIVGGYVKLMYSDGESTKEQIEEILVFAPEMRRRVNGARAITAIELHKISEYLQVSMNSLMKMSEKPMDMSVIHSFMGRVKTEEARKGIQLADELSDMILFQAMVCENGKKMEQSWEDK